MIKKLIASLYRRCDDWERGAIAVEFAFAAPVLITLALGAADFGGRQPVRTAPHPKASLCGSLPAASTRTGPAAARATAPAPASTRPTGVAVAGAIPTV